MSIAPAKAPKTGIRPYRLTVEQYLKMIDAGVFREGHRVELLGGMLVAQMTKHDPHDFAVEMLGRILRRLLSDEWRVREEKSVVLGKHWRPEPDIAVVRGAPDRSHIQAPQAEDIVLLVEAADSSYAADRGSKWRRYAACGISAYWIINIPAGVVEVYDDPTDEGKLAHYRDVKSFGLDDEIPVVIEGREIGRVLVRDVLPKKSDGEEPVR
jgi:Uma2 family endonuclease